MPLLRNLSTNPNLQNSSTGWFGPSGWTRTATPHITMPGPGSFKGTTAGNTSTARKFVNGGQPYLAGISIRATSAQNAEYGINWYSANGTYLGTDSVPVVVGGNTTTRIQVSATAPAAATEAAVALNGLDGGTVELGGELFVQTSATSLDPFDGNTPGDIPARAGAWDGTPGSSTSTIRFDWGALGPLSGIATGIPEIVATSANGALLYGGIATGFPQAILVPSVIYDDSRGRFRIHATGLDTAAIRVEVHSRPVTGGRWVLVRGGRVELVGGAMPRKVDDYEFVAGVDMLYRINVLVSPENTPDVVIQSHTETIPAPLEQGWIKFIAAPYRNRKVMIVGWSAIERDERNALHVVTGRPDPVAVTDVHGSRSTTIRVRCADLAEVEALDASLRAGAPCYLHTPRGIALPSMYAAIGRYSWRQESPRSQRAHFSIPLTEVSAPPPSIVGKGRTYDLFESDGLTYDEQSDLFVTYDEAMA